MVLLVVILATPASRVLACGTCVTCQVQKACGGAVSETYETAQQMAAASTAAAAGMAGGGTTGAWKMVLLPDTQIYAESFPQHFNAQTQWIADNAASQNIRAVLHEGDITNRNTIPQWDNAKTALSKLDGTGVPYILAPGNHDYGTGGNSSNRSTFFHNPEYFGPTSAYAQQSSMGGFFEAGKTDNAWSTFSAGGNDWIMVALEFGPRDEVVEWANDVIEANPDKLAILVTHAYMYYDDTIYDWATKGTNQQWNPHSYGVADQTGGVNDGQELWDKLVSKHENFRFVFNGHVLNDGTGYRDTVGENGNVVHQILANYQMNVQGGQGDMRVLEFGDDGETVNVRTYSPVLNRYDTDADQEFTLTLNQLPPPPPVIYHAVAGNLAVTGITDTDDNTVGGVTVSHTGDPAISVNNQINRGDYQITVEGKAINPNKGVVMASITQHSRPDFANRRASVEVGRNSFGDGNLSLSVMEAGNAGDNEVNFNASVAYFEFGGGWTAAHVNGTNGTLLGNAFNGVTQSQVGRTNVGRYTVNLGANAQSDGLLFAIGNNNDNIVVQTGLLAGGTTWDVRVDDNATDFGATGEDRDWSFVYLPYDAENMVGGLYDGIADTHVSSAGDFSMTRLATGQYQLSVTGQTPQTGMLITTITNEINISGTTAPDDNVLTYEPGPNGTFLINSYDLPTLNFQNTKFSWAFVGFEDPLSLEPLVPGPELAAEVDRATGLLTLSNDGDIDLAIASVTIKSTSGAIISANWNSIAENYDPTPGSGSVDADGEWTIVSSTPFNASEQEAVAGDGGLLTVGQVVDLGALWTKSVFEDLKVEVQLVGGDLLKLDVGFSGGPGNAPFNRSDLNTDGEVNVDDWNLFYPGLLTDISQLSPIGRVLAGDLNGDSHLDVEDFILFKADFELAQGAGSFDAMLSHVPEPGSVALVAGLALTGWVFRRRQVNSAA